MKKFDVVIGNPPYNESVKGAGRGGTSGGNPILYRKFIDQAFDLVKDGGTIAQVVLRPGIRYAHNQHHISYYNPDTSKHWHYGAGWYISDRDRELTNVAKDPIIRKVFDITTNHTVQAMAQRTADIFDHPVPDSRHAIIETPNGRDVEVTKMGYVIGNLIQDGPKLVYKILNTEPSYIVTTYPHCVENTNTIRFLKMSEALVALKLIKNHPIFYYLNNRLHEKSKGNIYRYLKRFDPEQIIKGNEYPVEWELTPNEIKSIEAEEPIWRTVSVATNP